MQRFIQKHFMAILVISEILAIILFAIGIIITAITRSFPGPVITAGGLIWHTANLLIYSCFEEGV